MGRKAPDPSEESYVVFSYTMGQTRVPRRGNVVLAPTAPDNPRQPPMGSDFWMREARLPGPIGGWSARGPEAIGVYRGLGLNWVHGASAFFGLRRDRSAFVGLPPASDFGAASRRDRKG